MPCLLLEEIDDALDHGFQIVLRLEPDEIPDLFEVPARYAHVLERRAIRFLIRDVLDRGTMPRVIFLSRPF